MNNIKLQLEELTCPSCIAKIEGALRKLNSVDKESVEIKFNASKVSLNIDPNKLSKDDIKTAIENLGFEVVK